MLIFNTLLVIGGLLHLVTGYASTKSAKMIDCGSVDLDEDYDELNHIFNHDDIVQNRTTYSDHVFLVNDNNEESSGIADSSPQADPRLFFNLRHVSNLSQCLTDNTRRNNNNTSSPSQFTLSYSTYFTSKLSQFVFDNYFYIDDKLGVLYAKKRIDREVVCAKLESQIGKLAEVRLNKHKSSKSRSGGSKTSYNGSSTILRSRKTRSSPSFMFKPAVLLTGAKSQHDSVNCDCKSDKCEIGFRFVAFKDRLAQSSSSNVYKYLTVKININDLNDNTPKFAKSVLYLNISESFGNQNEAQPTRSNATTMNNAESRSCRFVKTYNDQEYESTTSHRVEESSQSNDFLFNSNNLVPIDKAFDLDVGKNSLIEYKLILLKNKSHQLIDEVNAMNVPQREEKIKSLLGSQIDIESCDSMFELIGSNVINQIGNHVGSRSTDTTDDTGSTTSGSSSAMLFLKINKFLDREERDVYNFVLVALDKLKTKTLSHQEPTTYLTKSLNARNNVLIRLVVNDLNDNQPRFGQEKYSFNLNEVTEYSTYFELQEPLDELYETERDYYGYMMNATCRMLKNSMRVDATDLDWGLNSRIKYRLVQQIHRKSHVGSGSGASNPGNQAQQLNAHFDDNSEGVFVIDESDGTISLRVCQHLANIEMDRFKYLEYTALLDFESFLKHILVVEASDSNPYSPLQTVVTVEINLHDLNDNVPLVLNIVNSEQCADFSQDVSARTLMDDAFNSRLRVREEDPAGVKVSMQHFQTHSFANLFSFNRHHQPRKKAYSSKIVIDNLSEYSKVGRCLGELLINDADTPSQNRRIDAQIWLGSYEKLAETDLLVLRNMKSREGMKGDESYEPVPSSESSTRLTQITQTNEVFELFLNFQPDAEQQRFYEFTLEFKDNSSTLSFTSYVQLILLIKDENDNLPVFEQDFYNFTMDEWSSESDRRSNSAQSFDKNQCFARVVAHDADSTNQNSMIIYELNQVDLMSTPHRHHHSQRQHSARHRGNTKSGMAKKSSSSSSSSSLVHHVKPESNFFINSTTGMLCVRDTHSLDREVQSRYEFMVTAQNINSSVHSNVLVQINLNDLNDNRPEFLQSAYTFFVIEKDSNLVRSYINSHPSGSGERSSHRKSSRKSMMHSKQPQPTLVGTVKALDRDLNAYPGLLYYFDLHDNKSFYELNTDYVMMNDDLLKDKNVIVVDEDDPEMPGTNNIDSPTIKRDSTGNDTLKEGDEAASSNDQAVYEVTAIKYTLPDNEQTNKSSSSQTGGENKQDEFIFKYNNILGGGNNKNSSLPPSISTSTSVKKLIRLTTKKFFRRITNLDRLVHLNSTTGDIYLLDQLDREQIVSLRFNVYVKDNPKSTRHHHHQNSGATVVKPLNNSVPVLVEIIDVNDSRPQCMSQRASILARASSSKRDKSTGGAATSSRISSSDKSSSVAFDKPIDVLSLQVNTNKIEASLSSSSAGVGVSGGARLLKLYKFKCKDLDLNKNAEIHYEIEKIFLKDLNPAASTPSNLSPDEINEFLNEFFVLNAHTGVLYLNVNSYLDTSFYPQFRKLAETKFITIRVRISDNGIISLSSVYYLKMLFCFLGGELSSGGVDQLDEPLVIKESVEIVGNEIKYCQFRISHSIDTSKVRPVLIKSLLNEQDSYDTAQEEALLNDVSDESSEDKLERVKNDETSSSNEAQEVVDPYLELANNRHPEYDFAAGQLPGDKTTRSPPPSSRVSGLDIDRFFFFSGTSPRLVNSCLILTLSLIFNIFFLFYF